MLTLTSDAVFIPECTAGASDIVLTDAGLPTSLTGLRDPFYASTLPELYALGATTVIAYMLTIMLLITPRTFLHQGAVVLGRRGFTNGPSGSDAGIGIGGRPWLQKVAAVSVAISLTIATVDTFKVAKQQYDDGYMDGQTLQKLVEDGTELRIIRVISDTFLWLAQAQTLIRLFPRQREKIIIKWTAFALIILDCLFSILNNFVYKGSSRPHSFVDAVPALAYLFQLALSLLYAAWVIYYSITKKSFAFYHPQMRNICLVALLSFVAILVPVVFFVLDISKPLLAGWGDYVRWVGAAAASVVVWEWVERIEALEREDRKDGVLGREIFDGDEMLDASSTSDSWVSTSKKDRKGGRGNSGHTTGSNGLWPGMAGLANRHKVQVRSDIEAGTELDARVIQRAANRPPRVRPPLWPTRPPPSVTPVSRTDTASAESTVYAIRYHPISESTPPVREPELILSRSNSMEILPVPIVEERRDGDGKDGIVVEESVDDVDHEDAERPKAWQILNKANIFRRKAQDPPAEVSAQIVKVPDPISYNPSGRWDVRARLEDFAATQAEKVRNKARQGQSIDSLPRTVIPAPPRRRYLDTTLEESEPTDQYPRQLSSQNPDLTTVETEADHQPRSQRLSDPYTPDDLNSHSIHQRGTISIVTAQQEREGTSSPMPALEGLRDRTTPISFRNSTRTPTSPRPDGMPVVSIPAPPRRPRSEDED